MCLRGLPDGMFFKPKIQILVNFGGPWMEKKFVYCMYGHLKYITAIWFILWPYILPHFGKLNEKSGNPA
jgi:hypothetical protein